MMLFVGFQVIFLLRSHQHSNRLMTTIHPSYSSTTASKSRHGARGVISTVQPPPSKTCILPLWSYNSRHLSTASRPKDEPDSKRYLSYEAFPLGSFNSDIVGEIAKEVKQQAAKGTPRDVELAFRLLDRLFEEVIFVTSKIRDDNQRLKLKAWKTVFRPNGLVFKVINAWRKNGSDSITNLSPRHVFAMVKHWETSLPDFQSTPYINSMIIHASVSSQEPELAEEILHYLLIESKGKGQKNVNAVTFSSAIDAWVKSGREDAPQRAEALLKKMIEYSDNGWVKVTPDVGTFNSVIAAWAASNHKKAPHRAEELLRQMIDRDLRPDKFSHSSVLSTWKRSNEVQAPSRARAILKEMVELHKEGTTAGVKPNSHCYTAVISAYASRGNANQAKKLLTEQVELYQSTKDPDFLPNIISFTLVIHAWAKSGRPEAPQMAEAILQQVHDLAESWGEPSLFPTVVTFDSVLDVWAWSKDRDAPIRCEQILQRMQDLYEKGHANVQPDVVSFSTVLNSWAKSSREEAPERAEAILRHMERQHKANNTSAKANNICYTTVMDAWARSGRRDAAERTQALFDDLVQKYEDGDQAMKPNLPTYTTLISAWGRSKHANGAARAQMAFDNMMFRYRSGDEQLKPTVVHFTAVIDAWARAGDAEKAEQTLRQMDSNTSLGVKADVITYGTVMNAWSRSRFPGAAIRAQSLFDELQQKYEAGDGKLQPNQHVYRALITAWGRSNHHDRAAKAQAAFDHMLARYQSGVRELKPDVIVCNALVDAWVKAGDTERAEKVIRGMESNASIGVKPDVITYGSIMSGWSRSRSPKALDRMFALYNDMKKKCVAGDWRSKPDFRIFDVLLSTWSSTSSKSRQHQLSKAQGVYEDILARFKSGEAELKPLVDKYSREMITTVEEVQKK